MSTPRTVLFLGAGFSAPAGMPVQADLMREVVRRDSQLYEDQVRNTYTSLFRITNTHYMLKIPLEDIFTILDRAKNSGDTLCGLSHAMIRESHKSLLLAIAHEFSRALFEFDESITAYPKFFEYIVNKNISKYENYRIITPNWDTIPDFLIHRSGRAGVDYGFRGYALSREQDGDDQSCPTTIRLLKLHGSVNWQLCSCCRRVYFSEYSGNSPPISIPYQDRCKFCLSTELESSIITPTLLKDLQLPHYAATWHESLLELQQADRIVFLGYSLPYADYEIRYLILKALAGRVGIPISITLFPPEEYSPSPQQVWERDATRARFENLLGGQNLGFIPVDIKSVLQAPERVLS